MTLIKHASMVVLREGPAARSRSNRIFGFLRARAAGSIAAATLLYGSAVFAAEVGVTPQSIVIGQSTALTGPIGAGIGTEYSEGFKVALEDINRRGGVLGRSIKLVQMDDGYVPQRSLENTKKILDGAGVFALVGSLGTANIAAVLPLITERRVPLFAAFSGADSLRRENNKYLFTVMAAYGDETEKMVQHLTTINLKSIAVVYLNNSFGKDGLVGVEAALKRRQMALVASVPIETDASDAAVAAKTLAAAKPQAVIATMAGKATIEFIREFKKTGVTSQILLLSVADSNRLVQEFGKGAAGIIVAQTMPSPYGDRIILARDYRRLMKEAGKEKLISYASMTGFVSARAFAQVLQQTGAEPTREKFMAAVGRSRSLDLGGYELRFAPDQNNGSRYVELTMINSGKSTFLY